MFCSSCVDGRYGMGMMLGSEMVVRISVLIN